MRVDHTKRAEKGHFFLPYLATRHQIDGKTCGYHHNRQMTTMIHEAGHRLVFRAPYCPIDGTIEYVFNTTQGMLIMNMHKISNGQTLVHEVGVAIAAIPTFVPYFINCGFW